MRCSLLATVAAATFVVAAPVPALHAQGKAVELSAGLIAYQSFSCTGCTTTTVFGTGGALVAAGFYLNPMIAIEPALTVSYASSGGTSATTFSIAAGLPIYFDKGWGRKGFYVEPTARYTSYQCTGCTSERQPGVGIALGWKAALGADAALRFHASYDYGFKTTDLESNDTIGVAIGLSVFIK